MSFVLFLGVFMLVVLAVEGIISFEVMVLGLIALLSVLGIIEVTTRRR